MREFKCIVIHHSASPRKTTREEVERWHLDRGFSAIGYHYVIEWNGIVRFGRPLIQEGAHCKADGANHDSIGICVAGDNTKPGQEWNTAQIASLGLLIRGCRLLFGDLNFCGHRDVPGAATECPGVSVQTLLTGRV